MKKGIKTFLLCCNALLIGCTQNSTGSTDIIIQRNLSETYQQLIADYIWFSLGDKVRIGIAALNEETAFSFIIRKDCEEIPILLPLLKLERSNEGSCQWVSQFDARTLDDISILVGKDRHSYPPAKQ